ncbi:MAG: hemerythrin-like metal-binding protein [Holophagaceae bacterium]|nr:hemerythrin-like metal-binding protein [Holophagaceae bacterium]
MMEAAWDPQPETGIDVIDAQHRTLLDMMNDLAEAFRAGRAADQARECLALLAQHGGEHFQTEERFMWAMGDPDLAAHRVEHAQLTQRLQELRARQGRGYLVTAELATLVADWRQHHLHGADQAFLRFTKTVFRG